MEVRNAATSLVWWNPETQVKVIVATTVALFFITSFILCRTLSDHPIFAKKWSWISLTIALPNIIYLVYRLKFTQPVTEISEVETILPITQSMAEVLEVETIPMSQSVAEVSEVEPILPLSQSAASVEEIAWFMEPVDPSISPFLVTNIWGIVLDYVEDPYQKCQLGIHFIPTHIKMVAECLECAADRESCLKAIKAIEAVPIHERIDKFRHLSFWNPQIVNRLLWGLSDKVDNFHLEWAWGGRCKLSQGQMERYWPVFKDIVKHGLLGSNFSGHSGTLLMKAACEGEVEELEKLLSLGMDPNEVTKEITYEPKFRRDQGKHKPTPPTLDRELMMEAFVDDAGWQRCRGGGNSALHYACCPKIKSREKIIRRLIKAKGNPDLKNVVGLTPRSLLHEDLHHWLEPPKE